MKCHLVAVGKAKHYPELQALCAHYIKRLPRPFEVHEIEANTTCEKEGERMARYYTRDDHIIALDAAGKSLDSFGFAEYLRQAEISRSRKMVFMIGGSNGLSGNIKEASHLILSLGAMTWPHMLVRVMLLEQLYRAHTIHIGHPYHLGHS
jgi:23S rRNA (pseudouridine1915-N3)-methyltransferase